LLRAETIIGLCREFHVLPSQLLDEPGAFLQLIAIDALGHTEGDADG
jgi:hypothetical protein